MIFFLAETTDSEVRDLFAEFGTVELISVPRNRETGQARGFAFVDMSTREELEKAIAGVNGLMYGGRTIRAAESLPKEDITKETKRIAGTSPTYRYAKLCICLCFALICEKILGDHVCILQSLFLSSVQYRGGSEEALRWQPSF